MEKGCQMVLEKGRFVFESLCLGKMTKHHPTGAYPFVISISHI